MGIRELTNSPDLDKLDPLMCHQTTLQRQLSTAISELLTVTKLMTTALNYDDYSLPNNPKIKT